MQRTRLEVQGLEHREVPAQFGIPWPNGTALTVSFAPDGTNVDGTPNQLAAVMARSGLSTTIWHNEILRALQEWTSDADLNVGVVDDDGSALGANGNMQADARFGDIRIFAVPLSNSVLAITTPPGDLGGTRTGDIILNANSNFGVGAGAQRDLYTILLQEGGHALGVGNSPDQTSVMYEYYSGARTGLSTGDVAQIQKLYSARPAQTWEPVTGNDTAATATPLLGAEALETYGDIASASDTDWYTFTASAGTTTVTLQVAGQSLLTATLTVFDAGLNQVDVATADGPGNDLSLTLANLAEGETYSIRVDNVPDTSFSTGQYILQVTDGVSATKVVTLGGESPIDDANSNDSYLTADRLDNLSPTGSSFRTFAHLQTNDADVYKVRSPFPGMNRSNVLAATVRAFDDILPQITVYVLPGIPVSTRLIADRNGLYTVQVDNALPNVDYYLSVQSRSGTTGDYELRANFRSIVAAPHVVASGLLTLFDPSTTGTLEVIGSAQIYFRLTAALTPIIGPSVTVRVYDAANQLKFQLLARAGDTADGVALLGPGSYRIVIAGHGGFLPFIASGFSLATSLLTDPVGVTPQDPNNPNGDPPPPPPPSGYNYYNDRGYYTWGERTPTNGGG